MNSNGKGFAQITHSSECSVSSNEKVECRLPSDPEKREMDAKDNRMRAKYDIETAQCAVVVRESTPFVVCQRR
jgi:hypothetical protein